MLHYKHFCFLVLKSKYFHDSLKINFWIGISAINFISYFVGSTGETNKLMMHVANYLVS